MNNGVIILLVIVVLSAVIGGVSQLLKNQQQNQQAKAARTRADARAGNRAAGSQDVDRFLEEIDKLRGRKSDDAARPAKAAPVAAKRSSTTPVRAKVKPIPATPVARALPPAFALPSGRGVEHLPVAPVLATPSTAPVVTRPTVKRSAPKSEFARQMAAMLASPHSLPASIILQEVLGPPKCNRRM